MSGLSTKKWHEAYKNVVILNNPQYTGMRTTLCSLADGASVLMPIAVSADAVQIGTGNKLRFGGAAVYIRNTGNASMLLNAARVTVSGRLVLKTGNPLSAVSIIGGTVAGGTVRAAILKAQGQASFVSLIGTVIRSGNTIMKTTGIQTASLSVSKLYSNDDIKMASGKKILTNGTTGVYSPSSGELHFQITGNGILIVNSTSIYPKTNETVALGTTSYRFSNGYIKTLYVNGITASTVDIKAGTFKGSLASATAMKTPAANVSLLRVASANGGIYRGTKAVMTTVSGGTVKGTTLAMTTVSGGTVKGTTLAMSGNAGITGNVAIEGSVVTMKNLPLTSAGLGTGDFYVSGGFVKMVS